MTGNAIMEHEALKWTLNGGAKLELNSIAEEVPLALVFNGESFAVMMVSPSDLTDFVVGFSFTEDLISNASEIDGIEFTQSEKGITAYISVSRSIGDDLRKRKKNVVGRTGCGLCGEETLEAAMRLVSKVNAPDSFETKAIQRALQSLETLQTMNHEVGTLHGAAWSDKDGNISLIREDVGRHNALDKLIGALLLSPEYAHPGFVLITSRASYEMVTKVARANVGLLVAVSGPTSLAIKTATNSDVTLVGFARNGRQTIYTHEERIFSEGNAL
ncbi:MAG: formate dehydrogenase accessory sulfurtransferase FdhD [Proteobacteria bacterium]|nr:formate dehydrogenase accessory sulfurtransferase FdhD [Pseudomonadota bacterium]MDA1331923.1 formate dehydrogenase accessory sulfurtransferase FdhD [Pseudomonadota bacterium]